MPGVLDVNGLTIIVATADPARFRAALTTALAQAALGGRTRIYCHERSVALLVAAARDDDESAALAKAGMPDRQQLLDMALDAGIALIACQTGLVLCGLALDQLVAGVEGGGLIGVLADLGDDRLLSF